MTAACPACAGAAPAAQVASEAAGEVIHLSLPGIHCAGCIAGVERTLGALPGVRAARVNLGRRRARVVVDPGTGAGPALTALAAAGYEAQELDEAALDTGDAAGRMLLARIAVAGFAMMNVMALSVAVWSGAGEATRALFHWAAAAIALPALAFAAVPFFTSAWGALRAGRLNMDVPIALAIALAGTTSLVETILDSGADTWFDAALSLTFFLLAGRYLDHRARATARSAAAELTALELPRATRLEGDRRVTVAVADIRPGDRIALAVGARAPVDGVAEAACRLDRSALTGEADPVEIQPGDAVCAGETVLGAPLVLRATARAEDSTLRRLARLVEVAETGRHRYQGWADWAAKLYAPLVHGLSAVAFVAWWVATGSVGTAIAVATAVLIITCPCALGLAVPAVTASMTGRLFRAGVLLKSATALERLAEVDTVLLDKTGTLTTGRLEAPDLDPAAAAVARALAEASDHPVSRAVAHALQDHAAAPLTDLREVPGEGMHGLWDGAPAFLGRGPDGTELRLPDRTLPLATREELRPGAAEAVAALRAQGLSVHLVTGDHARRAAALAARLDLDEVHSGIAPEEKAALVAEFAARGARVLMVGDGINDAAALAAAHASLAPATALDAARVAADGVLLAADLRILPETLSTAKRAARRIRQNLAIAAGYNCVAIPVALSGLAGPLAAAIAMSTSSVTVVANAVRR
ncbi:heavy metal translocating P-type ATPase [Jannaschia seohaensis]|uniref:Cu2+-exporting ATPase n=1 Tax=Jannaschia seohaensis TaxID=475081 RepID=A0A2Y9A2R5_9RHOB|nr:heavy metal translocating P-type ATPase [Jannaschia seohaensis]PWJ22456.1 Cu2+-exporting ATPase [Jannaschia seohaensis]SSA38734.1 Cu2+-exporting ATPase [Jannaschia seohaensis]